jgi:hypothetical protein
MSYETRAYDDEHGDPVVVLVATGTHDVSRLVNLLNGASPNCEQIGLAAAVLRQLRRHNAGRAALRLLRDHGGTDFTEEPAEVAEDRAAVEEIGRLLGLRPAPRVRLDAAAVLSRAREVLAGPAQVDWPARLEAAAKAAEEGGLVFTAVSFREIAEVMDPRAKWADVVEDIGRAVLGEAPA